MVGGGNPMKKYEILLALSDGDFHHLMAIRKTLEDRGYSITAMCNGSATDILRKKSFDLVITDVLTVLEEVKALNPEIMAIFVLDTNCESIPTSHAIRSFADDFLFKPFELTEMEMRVTHCIEKLEFKQRNAQPEWCEQGLNEKVLTMVKIMSHDVRGSLLSIYATLKLLSRGYYGKMDEEVVNIIRELISKTMGLVGVTEEYLVRSFSVGGDFETQGEALDLIRDILTPIFKELYPELKGHRLFIDRHLLAMSNKLIPLRANRIFLKMVFRNLLQNAIKYGDKGGTITLGFQDNGSSYQLSVYNSGNPIPEEYRQKLFTKFMGRESNENGKGGDSGMGLGLYLIKKVIQKLGGDIQYEAKENGSNFIFTIPSNLSFPLDSSLPIGVQQFQLATVDH
jgi:signal transduction histidine kinase